MKPGSDPDEEIRRTSAWKKGTAFAAYIALMQQENPKTNPNLESR
jgi:hypothetical protein